MKSKLCRHCNTVKPSLGFYPSQQSGDGLQYECIACSKVRRRRHWANCEKLGVLNYSQRTQRRLKLTTLQAYGGKLPKCKCCGESMIEFLSIDHIGKKGVGSRHRKEIRKMGTGFYHWLRRHNYPKGFRVLCHNCNQAIGNLGYCPHKRTTPFCPPPRARMIRSEIKNKIRNALKRFNAPTIAKLSKMAKIHYETARRYRAEFQKSGLWQPADRRRTFCMRGHKFTKRNSRIGKTGYKRCKKCIAITEAKKRKNTPRAIKKRRYWARFTKSQRSKMIRQWTQA